MLWIQIFQEGTKVKRVKGRNHFSQKIQLRWALERTKASAWIWGEKSLHLDQDCMRLAKKLVQMHGNPRDSILWRHLLNWTQCQRINFAHIAARILPHLDAYSVDHVSTSVPLAFQKNICNPTSFTCLSNGRFVVDSIKCTFDYVRISCRPWITVCCNPVNWVFCSVDAFCQSSVSLFIYCGSLQDGTYIPTTLDRRCINVRPDHACSTEREVSICCVDEYGNVGLVSFHVLIPEPLEWEPVCVVVR